MPFRLSSGRRLRAAAIAAVGTPVIDFLGATYRWHESGLEHLRRLERDGRPPIFAFWHGRILAATLYWRDRGIIVITSENFDGEWVARIIERFGYEPARGSTSRGGSRALVQMRREMRAGRPVAFTVDGPRGPARVAQAGAAWLASATGNPILPFHIEASEFWTMNSWDRHQVPRPGSTVAAVLGPPIDVEPGADETRINAACRELEAALADAEETAIRLVGRTDAAPARRSQVVSRAP